MVGLDNFHCSKLAAYGIARCAVFIGALAGRCVHDKRCSELIPLVGSVRLHSTTQHKVCRRTNSVDNSCACDWYDLVVGDVWRTGCNALRAVDIRAGTTCFRWRVVLTVFVAGTMHAPDNGFYVTTKHVSSRRTDCFWQTQSIYGWYLETTDQTIVTPSNAYGTEPIETSALGCIGWHRGTVLFRQIRLTVVDPTGK